MKKKIICLFLGLLLTVASFPALADDGWKVVLGADLSEDQKKEAFELLGVEEKNAEILTLTHEEEVATLGSLVPAEKLGSRSLSCVSVRPLEEGAGIKITAKNITWVTDVMYAAALATAGVKDAEVTVACPIKVSGTAALAGIFKAYEASAGTLSDLAKSAAAQELVTTGELGDIIGQKDAAELIALLKKKALEEGYDDPAKVRDLVVATAKEYGVTLSDEQIDMIVNLIVTLIKTDIDPEQLAQTVTIANEKLKSLAETSEKALSFVQSIKSFFAGLTDWVRSIFK